MSCARIWSRGNNGFQRFRTVFAASPQPVHRFVISFTPLIRDSHLPRCCTTDVHSMRTRMFTIRSPNSERRWWRGAQTGYWTTRLFWGAPEVTVRVVNSFSSALRFTIDVLRTARRFERFSIRSLCVSSDILWARAHCLVSCTEIAKTVSMTTERHRRWWFFFAFLRFSCTKFRLRSIGYVARGSISDS